MHMANFVCIRISDIITISVNNIRNCEYTYLHDIYIITQPITSFFISNDKHFPYLNWYDVSYTHGLFYV